MEKRYFVALVLFTLLSLIAAGAILDTCDNYWEPYKDEKCLKVFHTEGLITYEEAESFCKGNDATLVSIGLENKQKFIEDFLKSKKIVDNVWIGLKYERKNSYVWLNNTRSFFSNWASGSPKNDPAYCVQIETGNATFGKWADVTCTTKNLALCEKSQTWSFSQLQNIVINMRDDLFPIGFTYVQLPNEKPPTEIWPTMTWDDVTSVYAGAFFRAEGGNSSSFGAVQEEGSPRLVKSTLVTEEIPMLNENEIPADGEPHVAFFNRYQDGAFADFRLLLTVSASEVRPRNMAIRIWKRTE